MYILLVGDVNNEKGRACVGQGIYGKFLKLSVLLLTQKSSKKLSFKKFLVFPIEEEDISSMSMSSSTTVFFTESYLKT